MSYEEEYRKKLISASEAVGKVKSGMSLDWGYLSSKPVAMDMELAKRAEELKDVNIKSTTCPGHFYVFDADRTGTSFTYTSGHCTGPERKYVEEGFGSYSPSSLGQNADWLYKGYRHVDIAMFSVAPMDKYGFFNFGPQTSFLKAICDMADLVIVEINHKMPIALGGKEECVHISDIDFIVEDERADHLLTAQSAAEPSDIDRKIASYVIDNISSGSCLQLGIGGVPNAVGQSLLDSDITDLGIHTEMYTESMMELYLAGKVSGKCKDIDKGKMVYAFALGSQKLYDFIDNNPALAGYPCSYTNNPIIIAKNHNAVSINNALEVDFSGQVCAESVGPRHISGSGGQLEFAMGSYYAEGGKSFICLSSTYTKKDGTKESRIRPMLRTGAVVTTPRPQVMYLVTEHGIVNLKAKSLWERAEQIIGIAAPEFREELIAEAEKLGVWRRSNKR